MLVESVPKNFVMYPEKRNRILLVEDDEHIQDMLVDGLEARGYRVKTADNLNDALGYENEIDFVVTDLQIPKQWGRLADVKNGIEVIEYYGKRGIPIVVASFSDMPTLDFMVKHAEDKTPNAIIKELEAWI